MHCKGKAMNFKVSSFIWLSIAHTMALSSCLQRPTKSERSDHLTVPLCQVVIHREHWPALGCIKFMALLLLNESECSIGLNTYLPPKICIKKHKFRTNMFSCRYLFQLKSYVYMCQEGT